MTSRKIAQNMYRLGVRRSELWDISNDGESSHTDASYKPDSLLGADSIPKGIEQYHKPTSISKVTQVHSHPAIFSFFSGAGFLDLGFESTGFRVAYVNEYYKPFLEAYQFARQHLGIAHPQYGYHSKSAIDFSEGEKKKYLTEIVEDARKSSNLIGFIGGPPCPDFSIGGKNKGRHGDNGKLSATYIDLICQQQPDFFLFENVKGLWKTKKHREFYEEIKKKTQDYYFTTNALLNAIEYGVPQDRERIILLGFRRDLVANRLGKATSLFDFPWKKHAPYAGEDIFGYPWPSINRFEEDSIISCSQDIIQELTVEYWFRQNNVLNHPNSQQFFQPRAALPRLASIYEGDDSKKSFKRLHRWRYSPTAAYGHNEVHLHPYKIRRISVAEALAIQSLPSNYFLPPAMTLTDAFKATGNGVPFLMARAIAQTILEFLGVADDKTYRIQYYSSDTTFAQEPGLPVH